MTVTELDAHGFARLCRHDQAELNRWLRRQGFEPNNVQCVVRYPLGIVHEIIGVDRDAHRWEGRFVARVRYVLTVTDDPAPIP